MDELFIRKFCIRRQRKVGHREGRMIDRATMSDVESAVNTKIKDD